MNIGELKSARLVENVESIRDVAKIELINTLLLTELTRTDGRSLTQTVVDFN